ncbi:MAG: hypothetical protein P4L83_12780 [Nevskia sp.]|nr:hypothetical protein [Nevskia sp.]
MKTRLILLYAALAVPATAVGSPDAAASSATFPLLGSAHGGHVWTSFCANQPDSAALPPDPRSLVQPGVNQNKAVYFNAYWKNCHADPALIGEQPEPATCGEWRQSVARGDTLLRGNGAVGALSFFGATNAVSFMTIPAVSYNRVWKEWGLNSRPDNFDALVGERYGFPLGSVRNPYPQPGEDPNKTSGGSGQLPIGLTQTHNADGSWSGNVSLTCNACHSTVLGNPADGTGPGALYGSGNTLDDIALFARDIAEAGTQAPYAYVVGTALARNRGTNSPSDLNLFYTLSNFFPVNGGGLIDQYTLGLLTSGSVASNDAPAWWNAGHRPVKFQDGILPGDSDRTDLVFGITFANLIAASSGSQAAQVWLKAHDQDAGHFIMSLQSPSWPYGYCSNADGTPAAGDNPACINTPLAEQGAILFHSKNLWDPSLENPVPKPDGGNGSCASCHGAYSPQFVNDPSYLDTPALEGIASYVVPKAVIGTDPARVDTNNKAVQGAGAGNFLNYPETAGTAQSCAALGGSYPPGYLAPPLYGVWATAPYFHNGSVPTVWDVLKPSDRPPIWQRVSAPARADQQGQVVMGFDTDMPRAYDMARLGWQYTTPACGSGSQVIPYLQCNPTNPNTEPLAQALLSLLDGNLVGVWNLGNFAVWSATTPAQIDQRKTYNTHLYSQGNEGHAFTSVLTDGERKALIEYLKTL